MPRGTTVTKQRETGRQQTQAHEGASKRGKAVSVGTARAESTSLSPGLPMLRTSERGTLKKCEFLWDLTYNQRIKPQTEMPALRFGSLIHHALAGYYVKGVKRGVHPAKGFKKAYDADIKRNTEIFGIRVEEDEVWVNAEELGVAMMNNYVDEYGADPDWEVLATEMPFQVVVRHPVSDVPWFIYTGIVDGVWKHRRSRELWIPDHKSTKGIGPKSTTHLSLDEQAGAYWSWGVDFLVTNAYLKKNQQLNGMLYNFLAKKLPDERQSKIVGGKRLYLNLDGSISKKQPSPFFLRHPIFRDEYDRQMAKHWAMLDYERILELKTHPDRIRKSPGMFTCPMCSMRDLCELHETGADWQSFMKETTKTWDPYEAHEVYDGR